MSSLGSNRPTRDARLERQQQDNGEPGDEVHSADHSVIYHDDRDCIRLEQVADENVGTDTRRAEKRRWKAPCLWCVLNDGAE